MILKFSISNMMGIDEFDLELEKGRIKEVIGPNNSGKTSLACSVSALLARKGNPYGLAPKIVSKAYLRDGFADSATAEMTVEGEDSTLAWIPTKQSFESPGTGVLSDSLCRPESVGLVDFCALLGDTAKSELFQSILLPSPEKMLGAIQGRLEELVGVKEAKGVMKELSSGGWKTAEKTYKDRATVANVTGRKSPAKNGV